MMAISTRRPLPFLLGIGFLICVAEGFVGMFRIIPVQKVPRDHVELLPSKHRHHPRIASSLYTATQNRRPKIAVTSQEIQEMASFVCVRLMQSVMAKALEDDGESIDLKALERLTAALQKRNDNDSSSSMSATDAASDDTNVATVESKLHHEEDIEKELSTMEMNSTVPEPTPLFVETPEEEESVTSDLVDEGWDDYDEMPHFHEEEFDDDYHHDPPFREEELDIYPEGSVDLPRAAPTYVVSPLEVVASNVVPLRPESIPQKKTELLVPGERNTALLSEELEKEQISLEVVETVEEEEIEAFLEEDGEESNPEEKIEAFLEEIEEEQNPFGEIKPLEEEKIEAFLEEKESLEVLEPIKVEKVEAFLEKKSETVFDASKAWGLDEIMASTKESIADIPPSIAPREVSLKKESGTVFDASKAWDLDEIMATTKTNAEETPRQQKNVFLEKEADTIFDSSKTWGLDEIMASTKGSLAETSQQQNESFWEKEDTNCDLDVIRDSAKENVEEISLPKKQNGEEIVRRKLLQARLKMNAAKMETNTLRAEEMVRRKLLQRRLDNITMGTMDDYLSKDKADTTPGYKSLTQDESTTDLVAQLKADELFHRRLLTKRVAYEKAAALAAHDEIQKKAQELFRRELLKLQLDITARELATSESVETMTKKKAEELFQRQLLAKKIEFDLAATETKRKKAEELFRRDLLKKSIEYEASTIEKELIQPSASRKEFEDTAKAIERLIEERASLRKELDEALESPTLIQSLTQGNAGISGNKDIETVQSEARDEKKSKETKRKGENHQTSPHDDWVSSLPTVTQQRYASEARISHSFQLREFNPTSWSRNRHFQTIVGTLFRKESMYSRGQIKDASILFDIIGGGKISDETTMPLVEFQWDKRFRVDTADGDFYVADWKYANGHENRESGNIENPVCLICHGLESCSESGLVKEIAIACNENNIDAVCLNFRGCQDYGKECNLTPRAYHLGFTDDLMQQIEEIHSKSPNRRIYLSGFSLGAGVVTRLLTELGPKAYDYNICGAAVNAVPFDVTQNHLAINGPGFTRSVYGDRLLASMKSRMGKLYDECELAFDKSEIDKCETIMDVENLMICSAFGFDDAFDYYDKVKTIDKLHKICVPQYVIQARDDPFFVGLEEVSTDGSLPLRVQNTEFGGHCGYVLHKREADENNCKTSWMPRQLARFFAHIEEARGADK